MIKHLVQFCLLFTAGLTVCPRLTHVSADSTTQLHPVSYELNARGPRALATFYEKNIGLVLLHEQDGIYQLGTPNGKVLLTIYPTDQAPDKGTTGLYHTAFLFKDRQELGAILKFLYANKVKLDGYADHAVSEAIYLSDPEGNGIELYSDRTPENWQYDSNGNIIMGNAQIDLSSLLASTQAFQHISDQVGIGHVHLRVNNLLDTQNFYQNLLGLTVTNATQKDAIFLASQHYHHHLGANVWTGSDLPAPSPNQAGLRQINWVTTQTDLTTIQNRLTAANYPFEMLDKGIKLMDNAGLMLTITAEY